MAEKGKRFEQAQAEAAYRRAAAESHEHGPGPLHTVPDDSAVVPSGGADRGSAPPDDDGSPVPPVEAPREDAPNAVAAAAAPAVVPPSAELEELRTRVAQLEAELEEVRGQAAENWDKFLRARADMENFRRRMERTYADLSRTSKKELLLKMLSVLDNLDRAVGYERSGEVDTQGLLTGLRMTSWQFRELLGQEGVKEITAVGEQFDPRHHEAIGTVPATEELPEGSIVTEIQKGYLCGDELLRPARVQVATRSGEC